MITMPTGLDVRLCPYCSPPVFAQPVPPTMPAELRDYFAAAVLTGVLANGDYSDASPVAAIASDAYRMADAMLQARKA